LSNNSGIPSSLTDHWLTKDDSVITGTRAVLPPKGFPSDGSLFDLELKDGRKIPTNLVILATGQTANSQFLKDLEPSTNTSILNPNNGFIRVQPTLQLQDPKYSNIFAVGDVADTGARKAARPGVEQAAVAVANIASMIAGKEPNEQMVLGRLAIHLTLGLVSILETFGKLTDANG
jgi:NADH dehydrogenase FAD-containing subunit